MSKFGYQIFERAVHLLRTMLRVGNLEASIRFYCDILGMKLICTQDYPELVMKVIDRADRIGSDRARRTLK